MHNDTQSEISKGAYRSPGKNYSQPIDTLKAYLMAQGTTLESKVNLKAAITKI